MRFDVIELEVAMQYGQPTWSLSRVDSKEGKDYVTVLTPVIDLDTKTNRATLVSKLMYGGTVEKMFLFDPVKLTPEKSAKFEPYFNELTEMIEQPGSVDIEDTVFSRFNPCKDGNINCWCYDGICVELDGIELVSCDKTCVNTTGGNDDGEGPLETDGTDGSTTGGVTTIIWINIWDWTALWPPQIDPGQIKWDDWIDYWDGDLFDNEDDNSFDFPEDGFDPSDTGNIEDGNMPLLPAELQYEIQLQGFINFFDLSMSIDELAEILPNDPASCAGLSGSGFYNCARFNLVNTLNDDYTLQLNDEEKWYLFNNFQSYKYLSEFLEEKGSTAYSRSSASIYLGLVQADLFGLTYEQAHNPVTAAKLQILINDKLETFGLEDQASLDPSSWYMIFKKEATRLGGNVIEDFLKAAEKGINQFWNEIVIPLKDSMAPILEEIGDQFPQSPEEWQALMAIYGPMLLELGVDVGTDFIPIVGEIKAFVKTAIAIGEGNYTDAAIEFLGGVAGIIPIGDLVVGTGKVIKASVAIFTAFKAIKALAKVSGNIYAKLIEYAQLGWEIAWETGLKKMIFKSGDEIVGQIDNKGVPNIFKNVFRSIIDPGTFKNLEAKILTPGGSNYIEANFIKTKSNKFNVTEQSLGTKFEDIVLNGDTSIPPGWGKKTEDLIKEVIEDGGQSGYIHFDGSYNGPIDGVNGFDGVFVKGDLSNFDEIIINESKQFTGSGLTLSGLGSGVGSQMTNQWVDDVAANLTAQGKGNLADAILSAKEDGKLVKIVTVVDRTSPGNPAGLLGGISILRVN